MGIAVRRGREFTAQDNREHVRGTTRENQANGGLNSIIVNEAFARRHWPNRDPIGQYVRFGPTNDRSVLTVVGVVGTVKLGNLSDSDSDAQAYLPLLQVRRSSVALLVKTTLTPEATLAAARRSVRSFDLDQPLGEVSTVAEVQARASAPQHLSFVLLGIFAALALGLAATGLYGVLAHSVTQRTREIGVRIALGARPAEAVALMLREGLILAGIGLAVGLAGAFALTRVLRNLLFGVAPLDLPTFGAVTVLLAFVALIASYLPARRAAKVNPIVALRSE